VKHWPMLTIFGRQHQANISLKLECSSGHLTFWKHGVTWMSRFHEKTWYSWTSFSITSTYTNCV